MFTIDLLKGQGIPQKSGPVGIAIAATAFAVPVIITIAMFSYYLHNSIIMSIEKKRTANYEARIAELSDAIELHKSFEKEKNAVNNCLSEVASSISRHTQWSPILATLARNMPGSVVLTRLSVKQRSVRKKVPQEDDPNTMIDVSVPVRTLQMNVCGSTQSDCGQTIKDFRDRLCSSTVLGPKLEDIRVSHESGKLDGQNVVSYEIDCVFKPGL